MIPDYNIIAILHKDDMSRKIVMEVYEDITKTIDSTSYKSNTRDGGVLCAVYALGFRRFVKYLIDDRLFNQIKAYEELRLIKLSNEGFFDNLIQVRHFKKIVNKQLEKAHKKSVKYYKSQLKINNIVRQEIHD